MNAETLIILFIILNSVVVATTLWLSIKYAIRQKWLTLLIPAVFMMLGAMVYSYPSILGYATSHKPAEKFELVGYYPDEPKYLYLLVQDKKVIRLHRIDYDRPKHQALEDAKKLLENGSRVQGTFEGPPGQVGSSEKTLKFQEYDYGKLEMPSK
jgi:hypothetical protein